MEPTLISEYTSQDKKRRSVLFSYLKQLPLKEPSQGDALRAYVIVYIRHLSPHVRESRELEDSGFQAQDSGFRNIGFRIPSLGIPDSKEFLCWIPDNKWRDIQCLFFLKILYSASNYVYEVQ